MASSAHSQTPEALVSLSDAQHLIKQLREQLSEEIAARARLERSIEQLDVPIQHLGDSVQFLSDAFEELTELFHGYRQALISLRATRTAAASYLADLREQEAGCDLEFLEREVPEIRARSRREVVQAARLLRELKQFAHVERPKQRSSRT